MASFLFILVFRLFVAASAGQEGNNCHDCSILAETKCLSITPSPSTNSCVVNADHGSWPKDGFCRVLLPNTIKVHAAYNLKVQLYNQNGWKGVSSGHPGVIYNVLDDNSFDFVYFRLHQGSGCYQTGYVSSGKAVFSKTASCPNGRPTGRVWFTVGVVVSSNKNVQIFLDNVLVTSVSAHFQTQGRGGVLVANGYQNIIRFRNYHISALPVPVSAHFGCRNVQSLPGYTLVDANHGSWPKDGFCRVLLPMVNNIHGAYNLTVQLYNQNGWAGVTSGHPGVIYNVIDEENFDFVYFRLHQGSGCYQTGYVSSGKAVFSKTASCPNGRPTGRVWFTVGVVVSSNKNVQIFLDNVLVTSVSAYFQTQGRGGVLVANGYQNIIRFRKLEVFSL